MDGVKKRSLHDDPHRPVLLGALLLLAAAVAHYVVLPMRERNKNLEQRVEQRTLANGALINENERLRAEVKALKDDPTYVEHLLRRRMGFETASEPPREAPPGD